MGYMQGHGGQETGTTTGTTSMMSSSRRHHAPSPKSKTTSPQAVPIETLPRDRPSVCRPIAGRYDRFRLVGSGEQEARSLFEAESKVGVRLLLIQAL